MYPIGVLFGLGFDTSSEIAVLGIASIQAAKGTSIWVILVFPLLFTAGMCLLDTTDGALMMALYTRTTASRDPVVVLYYSIVLTVVTVIAALIIGVIQLLSLVYNVAEPSGPFWDGVERAGEYYEIIGGFLYGECERS
jgi:high-affinity nickel-transport protein